MNKSDESKPLITIGIPTYNRADAYLPMCLEAAISQDYSNFEIIVSDNCSSDNTRELVEGFDDSRLRYIRHEQNIGAIPNFNFCLNEAAGAYFMMLHDDDLIDHDFLSCCAAAIPDNKTVGIIRSGTRIIDSNGSVKSLAVNNSTTDKFTDLWSDWSKGETSPYLCSTVFNTEYLKQLGGFHPEKNMLFDVAVNVKLTAAYPWANVQDIKASFRVHAGEMSSATDLDEIDSWCNDSHYLLSCFADIAGRDEQFMDETTKFVCRLAYKRCETVQPMSAKINAYALVDKRFESVIPWKRHLITRQIKRVVGKIRITISKAS